MDKYIEIIKDIVNHYSEEEWFRFKENSIAVNIPFNLINKVGNKNI